MKKIFTATTGRSGSDFLSYTINRYGLNCIAEHEPPNLLLRKVGEIPFLKERGVLSQKSHIVNLGRKFQRRYIFTDEMVGRGKIFQYIEDGDIDKVDEIVNWRIKRISKYEKKGMDVYIESSQYFLASYWNRLLLYLPELQVIKLTRNPVEIARSCANRDKKLFANFHYPDSQQNVIKLDKWKDLSKFQIYLHHCLDIEARFQLLSKKLSSQNIFKLNIEDLGSSEKIKDMFAFFGCKT